MNDDALRPLFDDIPKPSENEKKAAINLAMAEFDRAQLATKSASAPWYIRFKNTLLYSGAVSFSVLVLGVWVVNTQVDPALHSPPMAIAPAPVELVEPEAPTEVAMEEMPKPAAKMAQSSEAQPMLEDRISPEVAAQMDESSFEKDEMAANASRYTMGVAEAESASALERKDKNADRQRPAEAVKTEAREQGHWLQQIEQGSLPDQSTIDAQAIIDSFSYGLPGVPKGQVAVFTDWRPSPWGGHFLSVSLVGNQVQDLNVLFEFDERMEPYRLGGQSLENQIQFETLSENQVHTLVFSLNSIEGALGKMRLRYLSDGERVDNEIDISAQEMEGLNFAPVVASFADLLKNREQSIYDFKAIIDYAEQQNFNQSSFIDLLKKAQNLYQP